MEVQGTLDVFSGTQNTVSVFKVPKGPSYHNNDSISNAGRGLIRRKDEVSLGRKKLFEGIMIPLIFKRHVLTKSLWSLLEINAGVSKSGLVTQKGVQCITKPSANIFSDRIYHRCWGQWYSLLLPIPRETWKKSVRPWIKTLGPYDTTGWLFRYWEDSGRRYRNNTLFPS